MAGESCVFKPTIINKNNVEVESRLFNDLLHYSSNDREFAKKYYYIASSSDFINSYQNKIEYDENGEVTFKSLKELTGFNISEDSLIDRLNKDIGSGIKDYEEAMSLLTTFNSSNPYSGAFIATITPVEGGKVNLQVVRNTEASTLNLEEAITNKALFDRIKAAVRRLGGDISFIDEEYSKYDTKNAKKLESGLYNVILLSKNRSLLADAAEEAGHFAIGALGNNPLVKRLEALCTSEVQQKVLGKHYKDIEGRANPRRETAGFLVGQYIAEEVDMDSSIRRLAERIVNFVKRMFYKITANDVQLMRQEAENIAKDIARGFLSGDFNGNIENALNTKEILYSAEDSIPVSDFKSIIRQLDLLASEMSAIDKTTYRKWKDIEASSAIGRLLEHPSLFADLQAIDGITTAITQLADAAPEMIRLLDSVTYEPNSVPANAKKLRQISLYVESCISIVGIIDSMVTFNEGAYNEEVLIALKKARRQLENLITGDGKLEANLLKKQRMLYLSYLQDMYGSEYIERAARVLFDPKKFKLYRVDATKISSKKYLEQCMQLLEEDDSLLTRWLASMSNSTDYINQLAYKTKQAANKIADDATIKAWNDIRALEQKFKDAKINTSRLLERDSNGNLTGNYISRLNWGEWEQGFIEFKKSCKEEFLKSYEGKDNMLSLQKEYEWDLYFRPLYKKWHQANSIYDKQSGKPMPNETYENSKYFSLSDTEMLLLFELLELKKSFDDLLVYQSYNGEVVEVAHTTAYRMPQFRGSTTNRIQNLRENNPLGKAITRALRQNIINAFTITSEDRDYGSAVTHNSLDEELFSDELIFEKNKIKRVPLYGINKLEDMSQLSTDLFAGLVQYAAMANSYVATASVVDILETGKNVLSRRRISGADREEAKSPEKSRAYSRYIDFLDAQVYNLYANSKIHLGKLSISKLIGFLSGMASKTFLGGNVAGGLVNVGTGFIEITKEAISGESFTISDLHKANMLYGKYLPSALFEAGVPVKNNKMSLFMKTFNVQGNLEDLVKEYSTRKTRLERANPFGDNLMLPYKSGDDYMQTISFLATAIHTKFKDGDKVISMWEALEVVDIDPNNPKAGKTLKFKPGVKYIDSVTKEERDWTFDDEAKYQSMCRELNNRMHGIYNKMDKTAFHNKIWGQALLAMRGYALGYLQRKFAKSSYSVSLGRESEGSLLTACKMVLNMFGGKDKIIPSVAAILCPFGNKVKESVLEMGFSASQYANMRRNWADIMFVVALGLLKGLTAKEDDDDDDDPEAGLIYYFASRLYMEQNAYTTIWGLAKEQRSILSLTPSGFSWATRMAEISALLLTGEEYEKDSSTYEEGDKKWWYKAQSYIPYWRSVRIFEYPYEAAESYEYGRATYK